MTTASVPSTLVKCLYLFFDLPEMSEEEADVADANSEFTPRERRILLQKIFVQVKNFPSCKLMNYFIHSFKRSKLYKVNYII